MNELYEIHTEQTAPHKDLVAVVEKHQKTNFRRPISPYQREIFEGVAAEIKSHAGPVLLDSCCGTGRSTLLLAEQNPDALVIGLDKSSKRLSRNEVFREHAGMKENALLIQADVLDFWRLALEAGCSFDQHTIFYPNPYPKASDLTRRWHGHPVFPGMLQLSKVIEMRSNWRLYLEEFLEAAKLVAGWKGEIVQLEPVEARMTAFEKKYRQAGIPVYRLSLELS